MRRGKSRPVTKYLIDARDSSDLEQPLRGIAARPQMHRHHGVWVATQSIYGVSEV